MSVRHDVSLLTDDDIFLFNEGTHARLYERLGAHPMESGGEAGTHFAVWAPNAESVSVMGDFNGWSREADPLQPRASSGIWEGFVPGIGSGAVYKFHIVARGTGYRVDKGDPFAAWWEVPPEDRERRVGHLVRLGRRRVDGLARAAERARRADQRLRDAPRLVDAGRGPHARVPRHRPALGRAPQGAELHSRRAAAGDGAPLLRLVGLPVDRLLRADEPVRDAAGPHGDDRPAPQRGDRRDPGLGALALRLGRARPRVLRWDAPVRARRPAAGLSPRLGKLHLQLRPQRGPQLPALERDALARAVPRRRAARGRGRLDALPRLLAQGRASGSRTSSAAARTCGRSSSCAT